MLVIVHNRIRKLELSLCRNHIDVEVVDVFLIEGGGRIKYMNHLSGSDKVVKDLSSSTKEQYSITLFLFE